MKATFALTVSALVAGALAEPRNFTTIQPTGTFDPAAATAVQTVYPAQHHYVRGRYVDHLWHIILDSADYDEADQDPNLTELASKGLKLTNYHALTHPAQANYLGIVAGDTFGLTDERFVAIPSNVSTIAESFENQRVLWAQYAEDQPFTAYPGWTYGSTYSRAKNPFIAFDSITESPARRANLRSFKNFEIDFASGNIAQWLMIRPNLDHDGTNTDLATAAQWAADFLKPKLEDKSFVHRKLILLTFANSKSLDQENRVYSLLLGDLPKKLIGKTSDDYYDHYSILASTEANYDLPTLGRYDCGASVFSVIGKKANIKPLEKKDLPSDYNDGPTAGWLSDYANPLPSPNLNCRGAGRAGVLSRVKKIWKQASWSYYQWTFHY